MLVCWYRSKAPLAMWEKHSIGVKASWSTEHSIADRASIFPETKNRSWATSTKSHPQRESAHFKFSNSRERLRWCRRNSGSWIHPNPAFALPWNWNPNPNRIEAQWWFLSRSLCLFLSLARVCMCMRVAGKVRSRNLFELKESATSISKSKSSSSKRKAEN